jgi:hypothetical protein
MQYMRQCSLERKTPDGLERQVSWIPEQFARLGKYLKLLEDDVWENGWKVVVVGGRMTKEEANERSQDYKKIGKLERPRQRKK